MIGLGSDGILTAAIPGQSDTGDGGNSTPLRDIFLANHFGNRAGKGGVVVKWFFPAGGFCSILLGKSRSALRKNRKVTQQNATEPEVALQNQILGLVNAHWASHSTDSAFAELIEGKEPGHHIADFVDDRTCALLKVHLDTRYEGDRKGGPLKRSMGDIWVRSRDIYNPVNVKSGLQGRKGQPNVVSMRKLLNYLFQHWIDSYYLLMVKFSVSDGISHQAYLFDLLDWLEFIAYTTTPVQREVVLIGAG